jgi:hypothetical protein
MAMSGARRRVWAAVSSALVVLVVFALGISVGFATAPSWHGRFEGSTTTLLSYMMAWPVVIVAVLLIAPVVRMVADRSPTLATLGGAAGTAGLFGLVLFPIAWMIIWRNTAGIVAVLLAGMLAGVAGGACYWAVVQSQRAPGSPSPNEGPRS